ncbi:MAG: MarR family transcriptional regulator, partial [Nonomuraea sp.]|nr:MarR family transcriptional regulator [Nonomuraea sp.]
MLTTGGMTGRLDKLERAGLLRRSPDPHDRRGLHVTLTGEGRALVDEAVGAGLAVQTEALSALGAQRAGQLADLLRDLLAGSDRSCHDEGAAAVIATAPSTRNAGQALTSLFASALAVMLELVGSFFWCVLSAIVTRTWMTR